MHNKKNIILIILLTIVSTISFIYFHSNKETNKSELSNNVENITENNTFNLEFYKEKYSNNDIIAKLEIPNVFNILITKTDNNEFYLNHSINKESDKKGTEFMDYRTDLNSKQINIYGHNSKTYNLPFRKLEKFLQKDFFNKNEYIYLEDNNIKLKYHIMLIKEVKDDYEHMKVNINETNTIEHINQLNKNSINNRNLKFDESSDILVLQTCSYSQKDSYYIIVALKE